MASSQKVILIAENEDEFLINIENFTEEQSTLLSELTEMSLSSEITLQLPHSFDVVSNLVSFLEIEKFILASVYEAMDMYEISKLYEIDTAKEQCQQYLLENINLENVCRIYEFSYKHKEDHLQFRCWEKFDSSWDELFFTQHWLRSGEETVMRFVTRPIYKSLTEKDLFHAVYSWCKMKIEKTPQQPSCSQTIDELKKEGEKVRHIMEPFFPFIRFLALEWDFLENYIFNLYLFTDEEIKKIREYHTSGSKMHLPTSVCQTEAERRKRDDISLYEYTKKYDLKLKRDRVLREYHEFFCEILVHEDCFVTEIKLPIHLVSANINMKIEGRNLSSGENLPEQSGVFKAEGNIELSVPLLLRKEMQYELHVTITDEKIPWAYIKREALFFLTQVQYDHLMKRTGTHKKDWEYFYLEATLYF